MAINFPSTPTLNQEHTDANGVIWICIDATNVIWNKKPLDLKADKKVTATTGNIFISDASGNLDDSTRTIAQIDTAITAAITSGSNLPISKLIDGTLSISGNALQLTNGSIGFSDGGDENGAVNTAESHNGSITCSYSEGINYVKKIEGGGYEATLIKPVFGAVGAFGDWLSKGRWYEKHNLVTNGDFSDGTTTGWTIGSNGVITITDKQIKLTNGTASAGYMWYAVTTVIGAIYTFKAKAVSGTSSARIYLGNSFGASGLGEIMTLVDGEIAQTSFTATATTSYITLDNTSVTLGYYYIVDNISVQSLNESDYTPYTTPQTYLPKALECDSSGNVVDMVDYICPGITEDAIAVKDIVNQEIPKVQATLTSTVSISGSILPLTTTIDNFNMVSGGVITLGKKGQYILSYQENSTGSASKIVFNSTDLNTLPTGSNFVLDADIGDTLHIESITTGPITACYLTLVFIGDNP